MKDNYILIDYENIQNVDLSSVPVENFYIKIFVGTNQTKVPIDLVLQAQRLENRVEWIQVSGSGKNALDFHITFFLGLLTQKYPAAFFHIISKDTGFDPLIAYLKKKKIFCKRSEDIATTVMGKTAPIAQNGQLSLEDAYKLTLSKLSAIDKTKRPRAESTLKNHIKSQLGLKEITPLVVEIYQHLFTDQKIHLNSQNRINYDF